MPKSSFKKVIALAGSGQKFPVMDLVRHDPGMAAVLSKLIPSEIKPTFGQDGNRELVAPNVGAFKTTSEHTAQSISDAETVMQILPDMELAAQILVSSIISPKDMMTTELTYTVTEGLMAPDISAALIAKSKLYFEQVYKIKPLLSKMLRDMLFETGSYAVAVIPENSIDELINGSKRISMENLADTINPDGSIKSIGLLGPAVKKQPTTERQAPGLSLEAFKDFTPDRKIDGRVTLEGIFNTPIESYLTVTDNHDLLKIPQINQKIREQRIVGAIRSKAMESISTKLNDREMTNLIYKNHNFNYKPISILKTQEQLNRHTVGNPLILHLPSESVIPVYVPGCVEEQVGFFVLIDADGNPVSKTADTDYYQELTSRLNSNSSFASSMLTKVKNQMSGFDTGNRDHLDYSARAYGNMVEQDLLARLRNGVYGNGVALAKKEEIYRIMFSRALAKQHTQLLFIPVELMTYFAFKFNANGVGKSLLDDMKILNSLRAMLLFANVMASLKNSIGRTEVKLKLDESDPNPQKTIETSIHEITRSRQQAFPLGMNSPTDLVDWLQRSGFEFTFEGHPGLPDVNIDFGEKNSNYVKPDTDLEDSLRKRAIMSTGLSPETVDSSFQAEFATSILTNNVLLSKRVLQTQEQFTPQLSSHLRKCMMNSEELIGDLRIILENNLDKLIANKKDKLKEVKNAIATEAAVMDEPTKKYIVNQYLNEFIHNFEVSLPKPNSVTLENQLAALKIYTEALDETLEAWVSDKFFTSDTGGDVAVQVGTMKEVIKAYYIRQWMAENGVMTELSSLTTTDETGKPAVDVFKVQTEHISALTKSLTNFMVDLQPIKNASNDVMATLGETTDTSSDTSEDDSGGDGPTDDLGGDDPDLGDEPEEEPAEAPLEDEPTTEEPTAEEPKEEPAKEEPKEEPAKEEPKEEEKPEEKEEPKEDDKKDDKEK